MYKKYFMPFFLTKKKEKKLKTRIFKYFEEIIIHKKSCNTKGENCIVKKISSPKLEQTIRADIIKKATLLVKGTKKKKKIKIY